MRGAKGKEADQCSSSSGVGIGRRTIIAYGSAGGRPAIGGPPAASRSRSFAPEGLLPGYLATG